MRREEKRETKNAKLKGSGPKKDKRQQLLSVGNQSAFSPDRQGFTVADKVKDEGE